MKLPRAAWSIVASSNFHRPEPRHSHKHYSASPFFFKNEWLRCRRRRRRRGPAPGRCLPSFTAAPRRPPPPPPPALLLRCARSSTAAACPSSPLRHAVLRHCLPFFLAAPRRSAAAACHDERTPTTIDLVG